MKLTKTSKEIIVHECAIIREIEQVLIDFGESSDNLRATAIAIYNETRKSMSYTYTA